MTTGYQATILPSKPLVQALRWYQWTLSQK